MSQALITNGRSVLLSTLSQAQAQRIRTLAAGLYSQALATSTSPSTLTYLTTVLDSLGIVPVFPGIINFQEGNLQGFTLSSGTPTFDANGLVLPDDVSLTGPLGIDLGLDDFAIEVEFFGDLPYQAVSLFIAHEEDLGSDPASLGVKTVSNGVADIGNTAGDSGTNSSGSVSMSGGFSYRWNAAEQRILGLLKQTSNANGVRAYYRLPGDPVGDIEDLAGTAHAGEYAAPQANALTHITINAQAAIGASPASDALRTPGTIKEIRAYKV